MTIHARRASTRQPLVALVLAACGALSTGCPMIGFAQRVPDPPPVDRGPPPYTCTGPNGLPCVPPRTRIWLEGWHLTRIDSQDGVIGFTGQRWNPTGTTLEAPIYVGRVSAELGKVAWSVKLGDSSYDTGSLDMHMAGGGDIVVGLARRSPHRRRGLLLRFDPDGRTRFNTILHGDDDPQAIADEHEVQGILVTPGKPTYALSSTLRDGAAIVHHLHGIDEGGRVAWRRDLTNVSGQLLYPFSGPDGALWLMWGEHELRRYSQAGDLEYRLEGPPDLKLQLPVAVSAHRVVALSTRTTAIFRSNDTQSVENDILTFLEPGKSPVTLLEEPHCRNCYQSVLLPWSGGEAWLVVRFDHPGESGFRLRPVGANGIGEPFHIQPYAELMALPGGREMLYVRRPTGGSELIVQRLESQAAHLAPRDAPPPAPVAAPPVQP